MGPQHFCTIIPSRQLNWSRMITTIMVVIANVVTHGGTACLSYIVLFLKDTVLCHFQNNTKLRKQKHGASSSAAIRTANTIAANSFGWSPSAGVKAAFAQVTKSLRWRHQRSRDGCFVAFRTCVPSYQQNTWTYMWWRDHAIILAWPGVRYFGTCVTLKLHFLGSALLCYLPQTGLREHL